MARLAHSEADIPSHSNEQNILMLKLFRKGSSAKRSKSLDNIDQHLGISPPTKPNSYNVSPNLSKFRGLKKKLQLVKLSKSNSDIVKYQHEQADDPPQRLEGANSGNMLIEGRGCRDSKSNSLEFRRKSRNESVASGGSLYDQFASPKLSSIDKIDGSGSLTRTARNSFDSIDQFIVVDTSQYDSLEDGNSAYETDDVDGALPAEYTANEMERLLKKIDKTREELIRMQATKDENVQEYLKSVENSENVNLNEKTKTLFEKNNKKTNDTIQVLQKKLEKQQQQLRELEERGLHGKRKIMRVVQDSVRSGATSISGAVSKPLESINQFIKKDKKNLSLENISITVPKNQNEDVDEKSDVISARSNSDDDFLSQASSSQALQQSMNGSIDQPIQNTPPQDAMDSIEPSFNAILMNRISELERENKIILHSIDELKDSRQEVLTSFREEKEKNELLQGQLDDLQSQWNDLTELHQNEMMDLKQEMDRAGERIECVEYRFVERTDEIEERVESRITHMELQQQQQQQMLLSVDNYFDGTGNAKVLLSKFLSLIVSLFAILHVLVSTFLKIITPFCSTRNRAVASISFLIAVIILWRNSDLSLLETIEGILKQLFSPLSSLINR